MQQDLIAITTLVLPAHSDELEESTFTYDPDDDPDGDKPDSKSKKKSDGILIGLGSLITGGILNFVRKNFRAFSIAAKILAGV